MGLAMSHAGFRLGFDLKAVQFEQCLIGPSPVRDPASDFTATRFTLLSAAHQGGFCTIAARFCGRPPVSCR